MRLQKVVLDAIAEIGVLGAPAVPACLADPHEAWSTIMCGNEPWELVAGQASTERLVAPMRGLILYNQARPGSSGGSVSPVIVLFREYANRSPSGERALVEWIFANRQGSYEPFGSTLDDGARTVAEFRARSEARYERGRERASAQAFRDQEAHRLRVAHDALKATERLPNAVKRGDEKAVLALLKKGADPRVALAGDSLVAYAISCGHPPMAALLRELGVE